MKLQSSDIPIHYESKFEEWYSRASIRSNPRRLLNEQLNLGRLCFSPELAPESEHPLIMAQGDHVFSETLMQHLFAYLAFTDCLETGVVNRVARRIATGRIGIDLPCEMRLDAHKVYCDEAYHSLFSMDLMHQISALSGVPYRSNALHQSLEYLRNRKREFAEMRTLVELFFVIVSETLISAILAKIPIDARVVTAVRQMVSDHAKDESRHHALFAKLCEIVWPRLTQREQTTIGLLLPDFIIHFLNPNFSAIRDCLAAYLNRDEIEQVMAESYPPNNPTANTGTAGRTTLRLFERCGVFENEKIADAFYERGLLDQLTVSSL